jgi:hypothetical protein
MLFLHAEGLLGSRRLGMRMVADAVLERDAEAAGGAVRDGDTYAEEIPSKNYAFQPSVLALTIPIGFIFRIKLSGCARVNLCELWARS